MAISARLPGPAGDSKSANLQVRDDLDVGMSGRGLTFAHDEDVLAVVVDEVIRIDYRHVVIAATAVDNVDAAVARRADQVVAAAAEERIRVRSADEHVAASPAVEGVATSFAKDAVSPYVRMSALSCGYAAGRVVTTKAP